MLDTREGTREKAQMAGNFVKRKYGRRFLLKRFGRTIDLLSFVILCDNFFLLPSGGKLEYGERGKGAYDKGI